MASGVTGGPRLGLLELLPLLRLMPRESDAVLDSQLHAGVEQREGAQLERVRVGGRSEVVQLRDGEGVRVDSVEVRLA